MIENVTLALTGRTDDFEKASVNGTIEIHTGDFKSNKGHLIINVSYEPNELTLSQNS